MRKKLEDEVQARGRVGVNCLTWFRAGVNPPGMDPVVQPGRIAFWIRIGIAVLCLSATIKAPPARAQESAPVLVPSPGAYMAGKTGSIWLYYLNQSNDEVSWTYPPALNGTLGAGTNTYPVLLILTNAQPGSILV